MGLQIGLFGAAHGSEGGRGQKGPLFLKSVTHILQWWNLVIFSSYTLPKTDPKTYKSRDSPESSNFYYIKKYRNRLIFNT